MILVEIINFFITSSSGRSRNMVNVWLLCHSCHSCINIFFIKLKFQMLIENVTEVVWIFINHDVFVTILIYGFINNGKIATAAALSVNGTTAVNDAYTMTPF